MKVVRLRLILFVGTTIGSALGAQQSSGITAGSPGKITTVAPTPAIPATPDTTAPASEDVSPGDDVNNLIRVQVRNVTAPVTVLDKSGSIVDGIEGGRFHLFDNGKQQDIRVDSAVQPLSLVIAIEQSDRMEGVLTQIHRIGAMIQPLVTGENGEAAIISFDSRIQEKTGFTNDPDRIEKAISGIHAGNSNSRMIDSVERGVSMLSQRPPNRRRVILLISETRDVSSEARLRETLIAAQLHNVTVYSVNVSRTVTSLTSQPQPSRPDPIDPAAHPLPGGTPSTPTSIAQKTQIGNRIEFVPMLKEVYLGTKRIFVENPAEVFTEGTGGTQFSFLKQHGLEDAIERLSHEIHSQYLITYRPNNMTEGGFHQIRVDVDIPGLDVRTRPGYYLGGQ